MKMRNLFLGLSLLLVAGVFVPRTKAQSESPMMVRLQSHVPEASLAKAQDQGRLEPSTPFSLTVALNISDPEGLADLIKGLYDPNDSRYGKFISSQEFESRFGATAQDVATVTQYLVNLGFQIVDSSPRLIHVTGTSDLIEKSFNLEMHQYLTADNRTVAAANVSPLVAATVAPKIAGIIGLNGFRSWKAHNVRRGTLTAS